MPNTQDNTLVLTLIQHLTESVAQINKRLDTMQSSNTHNRAPLLPTPTISPLLPTPTVIPLMNIQFTEQQSREIQRLLPNARQINHQGTYNNSNRQVPNSSTNNQQKHSLYSYNYNSHMPMATFVQGNNTSKPRRQTTVHNPNQNLPTATVVLGI